MFKKSFTNDAKRNALLPFVEHMAYQVGSDNYAKQLNAIINKPDHSALLLGIKCPTLLVASRRDRVMPNERSEHMAQLINESKLSSSIRRW